MSPREFLELQSPFAACSEVAQCVPFGTSDYCGCASMDGDAWLFCLALPAHDLDSATRLEAAILYLCIHGCVNFLQRSKTCLLC